MEVKHSRAPKAPTTRLERAVAAFAACFLLFSILVWVVLLIRPFNPVYLWVYRMLGLIEPGLRPG